MSRQHSEIDEYGNVKPHDCSEILESDVVIRRISKHFIISDPKVVTGKRISTMAFDPSKERYNGLSVDIPKFMEDAGIDPKIFVTTPRWFGSVVIQVKYIRDLSLLVGYEPLDDNPYHGEIWGIASKSNKRALLKHCEWFVKIEDVILHQ